MFFRVLLYIVFFYFFHLAALQGTVDGVQDEYRGDEILIGFSLLAACEDVLEITELPIVSGGRYGNVQGHGARFTLQVCIVACLGGEQTGDIVIRIAEYHRDIVAALHSHEKGEVERWGG